MLFGRKDHWGDSVVLGVAMAYGWEGGGGQLCVKKASQLQLVLF
jgi:hypothetical protein